MAISINNLTKHFFGAMTYAEMLALTNVPTNAEVYITDLGIRYNYDGSDWIAEKVSEEITVNKAEDFPGYGTGTITIPANAVVRGSGATINLGTHNISVGNLVTISGILTLQTAGYFKPDRSCILFGLNLIQVGPSGFAIDDLLDGNLIMLSSTIVRPATTGNFFSITSSTSEGNVVMDSVKLVTSGGTRSAIGTISKTRNSIKSFVAEGYSGGMVFLDVEDSNFSAMDFLGGNNFTGNVLEFSGTNKNIDANGVVVTLDANPSQYALKFTGNYDSVKFIGGRISDDARAFAPTSAYNNKSVKFKFRDVGTNIADSVISSQMEFETATPETTIIPAINAWVVLDVGTVTLKKTVLERITIANDGIATYTGQKDIVLDISGKTVIKPATATYALECRFFWFCNGEFTVTFDSDLNRMNRTGIGSELTTEYPIVLYRSPGTLPAELKKTEIYWPVAIDTNSVQLSYTKNGSAIDITDNGTGTLYYSNADLPGGKGAETIAATKAAEINPAALLPLKTGYNLGLALRNTEAIVDIECGYAYYKNKE